jgi:hypothetical protein
VDVQRSTLNIVSLSDCSVLRPDPASVSSPFSIAVDEVQYARERSDVYSVPLSFAHLLVPRNSRFRPSDPGFQPKRVLFRNPMVHLPESIVFVRGIAFPG